MSLPKIKVESPVLAPQTPQRTSSPTPEYEESSDGTLSEEEDIKEEEEDQDVKHSAIALHAMLAYPPHISHAYGSHYQGNYMFAPRYVSLRSPHHSSCCCCSVVCVCTAPWQPTWREKFRYVGSRTFKTTCPSALLPTNTSIAHLACSLHFAPPSIDHPSRTSCRKLETFGAMDYHGNGQDANEFDSMMQLPGYDPMSGVSSGELFFANPIPPASSRRSYTLRW